MIFIKNDSTDPYFNIALEEYFLRNLDIKDTIFSLSRNKPCVIIGKHQNPYVEVNLKFVLEHGILVARRISGGGAVYHDLGNLNFMFISQVDHFDTLDIKTYIFPVVQALNKMGINAQLSDRNSITIDGKKISGTAEAFANKKLLCHGTLLFDSNLNILNEALKTNKSKIDSKSVNSVPSEVGNIKDFLEQEYDIETFKNKILENIFVNKSYKEYTLSEIDIENIEKLAKEKFSTCDWIYGESPPFTIRNLMQLPNGSIAFKVEVERDGNINEISFEGDLVNPSEIIHFEKLLQGKKYYIDNVIDILKNIEISKYFVNVTPEELISLMFY